MDVRTAERVDGLVGIADDRDPVGLGLLWLWALSYGLRPHGISDACCIGNTGDAGDAGGGVNAGKFTDEHVLRMVRVLVFVDEDITELVPVIGGRLGVDLEHLHGAHDEVVEVHGVCCLEPALVFGIQAGVEHVARLQVPQVGRLPGLVVRRVLLELHAPALELVLAVRDRREHVTRLDALGVKTMLLLDSAHQANAVGLIVDGERPVQSHCLAVTAQHAHACRVERRHPHALGGRPDERFKTVFHFARRLVGERDGQDLAWPGVPLAQCPRDAAGEHARLA